MTKPILELRDLRADVRPGEPGRGVSLTVGPGEVAAVLGGPGAGKSRLLRCIGLDFAPASGTIVLKGVDVTGTTGHDRRALRSRSIELVHPPAPHGEPDETVPGTRSAGLLGRTERPTAPVAGMRQRIQMAKALSHRSDVLLLDEPLIGVEDGVRLRILELLGRVRRERRAAVVIATRDVALARSVADHVVVLHDGEAVETGPTRSVLGAPRHHHTKSLVGGPVFA